MSRRGNFLPPHLFIRLTGLKAAAKITSVSIQIHFVHVVVKQLVCQRGWIT